MIISAIPFLIHTLTIHQTMPLSLLQAIILHVFSSAQLLGCLDPSDEPSTLPAFLAHGYTYCPTVLSNAHKSRRPTVSAAVHVHVQVSQCATASSQVRQPENTANMPETHVHCKTFTAQEDFDGQ